MQTDEVLDEDIEALLYAQVYYGKSKESDLTDIQQIDLYKEGTNPIGDSEIQEESTYPDKKGLYRDVEQKNEGKVMWCLILNLTQNGKYGLRKLIYLFIYLLTGHNTTSVIKSS